MKKLTMLLATAIGVSACTTTAPVATPSQPRPTINTAGLERVMGRNATTLIALFGQPAQDVREQTARKLQFSGGACVLDTYLYPQASGGEPVVTYVDARNTVGEDVDRAACVEALARR